METYVRISETKFGTTNCFRRLIHTNGITRGRVAIQSVYESDQRNRPFRNRVRVYVDFRRDGTPAPSVARGPNGGGSLRRCA